MENYQDWKIVTFNNNKDSNKKKQSDKKISQKSSNQNTKMVIDPIFGKSLATARQTKSLTRKQLAQQFGVNENILGKWETHTETPSNQQIAKLEKILAIKLPKNKKITIEEE